MSISHLSFFVIAIPDCACPQKLNDGGVPEVKRCGEFGGGYRGFRGGRGARGGFAHRNLHNAGLVRGGPPKTNGDT